MEHVDFHPENQLIHKSGIRYMIPAMIGLVFGQLSPMIGGICISQSLGEVPFSSLSTVEPINLVFSAIGALGGVGCGITVSKYSGSGDKELAARAFTRTVIVLATATVALAAPAQVELFDVYGTSLGLRTFAAGIAEIPVPPSGYAKILWQK